MTGTPEMRTTHDETPPGWSGPALERCRMLSPAGDHSGSPGGALIAGGTRAFTLLEMVAVVVVILMLMGLLGLTFANARPTVRVKRDASQTVAFLRNMWDHTKTTGTPLVLTPDFETGEMSYMDPRLGKHTKAKFSSKARVLGVKINDRLHSIASQNPEYYEDEEPSEDPFRNAVYLSEGRGLTLIAVLFGVPNKEEGYDHLTLCSLNLITGKGRIEHLTEEEVAAIFEAAEEASDEADYE